MEIIAEDNPWAEDGKLIWDALHTYISDYVVRLPVLWVDVRRHQMSRCEMDQYLQEPSEALQVLSRAAWAFDGTRS